MTSSNTSIGARVLDLGFYSLVTLTYDCTEIQDSCDYLMIKGHFALKNAITRECRVQLLATPWTPPSMGFPSKSTGVGCDCLLRVFAEHSLTQCQTLIGADNVLLM